MALKFFCSNTDCENSVHEIPIGRYKTVFNEKTGMLEPINLPKCEKCGKELRWENVFEGVNSITLNSFSSLSPERKKEIIHKRAEKHNKTEGRDEKHWRKNKIIKEFFGK